MTTISNVSTGRSFLRGLLAGSSIRAALSLRILTCALGLAALGLPACSASVAAPPNVAEASERDERSALELQSACDAGRFGSCLALSNRHLQARRPGDALSVMEARCKRDGEERSLTASNACFSAIILASRELGDEGRARQLARYRCERFQGLGTGAIGCGEVALPPRQDGALSADASTR